MQGIDHGPQKRPASSSQINAQQKQVDRELRLASAAPDLLAACEAFLEADNQCGINLAFVMAKDAVEKATGKSA
jgi:beta-N-acetylglucosaminidase